ARHLPVQLVHHRRLFVDARDLPGGDPAVVPAGPGPGGHLRLLHAQRSGHVVHAAGAGAVLLRDTQGAEPAHLFLRAGRAGVLDQPGVLPDAGRAPFPVQPAAVVAADHRDPLQRGHAGAGAGRQCELPADHARALPRAHRVVPAGVPVHRRAVLPGRLDPGHGRGAALVAGGVALHQFHRGPLAPDDVRLRQLRGVGRHLRAAAAGHRQEPWATRRGDALLAGAGGHVDLRDRAVDRRHPAGAGLGAWRAVHPVGGRHGAVLPVARRGRHPDVPVASRVRMERVAHDRGQARQCALADHGARRSGGMNMTRKMFVIFGGALALYVLIVMLIAVIPAIELSRTAPGPGVQPLTPLQAEGRAVFAGNGCGYCHTQQVRPLPEDKVFGRPSAPGDFSYQTPELLGSERTGPDLTNVGNSKPSDVWQYIHLYDPRAVVPQSIMPNFRFLFRVTDQLPAGETAVPVPAQFAPKHGYVVPTPQAK